MNELPAVKPPGKEIFVRDPIHGLLRLDRFPFILGIVSTPQFQRLRHLSQLGVSSVVYPGASHNRFAHSLGVMHVMEKVLDHLRTVGDLPTKSFDDLLRTGMATALLHDIGHGPLSHTTENILGYDHEDITEQVITSAPIADILEKEGVSPSRIVNVLAGTAPDWDVLLSQLMSSELDVDRLDYLTRDAYYTGVGFGNVDLDRIISMLRVYHESGDLEKHAITLYKGRHSLEAYILGRHLMYQAVYFHKATRGVERLIASTFRRVIEKKATIKIPDPLAVVGSGQAPSASDILAMDDHTVFSALREWQSCDDPILSDLCQRIYQRKLLKAIELTPKKADAYLRGIDDKFHKLAQSHNIPVEYLCPIDGARETPYTPYSIKPPEDNTTVTTNIFMYDEDGSAKEISRISKVVNAMADPKYYDRLYMPEEIRDETERLFKEN